jgi:hypothetical protein
LNEQARHVLVGRRLAIIEQREKPEAVRAHQVSELRRPGRLLSAKRAGGHYYGRDHDVGVTKGLWSPNWSRANSDSLTPGAQYCTGIGKRKVHHLLRR